MRLSKTDAGIILHEFCAGLGTKCDLDAPSHRKAFDKAVAALSAKGARLDGKSLPRLSGATFHINPRRPMFDAAEIKDMESALGKSEDGYMESDRDYVENNLELCVEILSALEMAGFLNAVMKARGK
jgi:hypothetical protein